jgi:eukaryotic-like serine/threonine-protein kinase
VAADLFEPQADPLIGRTLDGRYEVLSRLGVGGVGVVYRARQAQLGRMVAIKVLHQDAAVIPEWRRRFEREARALSALAHPNVVPVTDSGIDRGVPYLVMELLQGKTLADLIREGPLPLWRALDIARQLLRGLAFAHGKAIVHRDLKPANVFLQALPDQADHVRLLDFGMVKFLEGSTSRTMSETLTRVGVVFGTPAYMSPEMVKGLTVDARTDVYATGVLLFELLAGRRPFEADSHEGYLGAHLTQPVPSLEKLRPGLPAAAALQAVIEKAMAKKPSARFKDAGAMLAALEAVIAKVPASAMSGRPPRRKSAPHPRVPQAPSGSRFVRHAIILVAFAAGIAAVAVYLRRDRTAAVETAALPAEPASKPKRPAAAEPPQPAPPVELPPKPALPAEATPAEAEPAPTPAAATPAPVQPSPAPPAPPAEAPEPDEQPAERAPAPASRSAARDPWREPVPRVLKPIRDRVVRGAHMSQRGLKPVYAFAHENPDDPRPWLLLGRAYAELDWYSDSVDRYLKAYRIDATTRGDPQMLPDLLKAAVHPVAGRVAARAIRDIYGAEAIPAVDKAIERRASDRDSSARLTRLRDSLPR